MADKSQPADTGGLDEAFASSLAEHGGETTEAEPETETEAEPEASPVEEETRFTDTDPEDLPEANRKQYKALQADYTRKTQAIAAERKALEAERKRLDAWKPAMDAYDTDAATRARVNAAFAEVDAAAQKAGATTPDRFQKFLEKYDGPSQELLKELRDIVSEQTSGATKAELEKHKADIEKVNSQIEATQRQLNDRAAASQQKAFERAHPDWQEQLSPRMQKAFYQELLEDPTSDPIAVYESILEEFDKGATKKTEKVIQKIVDRAGNRPVRTPTRAARGVEQIDSMQDAFKSAMREHGK